ncbi:DMT family transporter [Pseudonocardia sp. CA-107938]|uniref:DMT family transporter n=1 Tax=Pseudonocardia sp. CA-107938 TaxID=3240021 RepID=UPI003D94CE0E
MNRIMGPLFVLLWSGGYLAGGIGTRDTPAFALTAWRFLLAAALLGLVAVVTRAPWPRSRRAWADLVVTGVLMQGVQFGAGYAAIGLGVPAALAAMVLCLSPVLVAVASGPVLGERLGRVGIAGSTLAVLGTLIAGAGHLDDGGSTVGFVLLLVALVGFAAGTLYQKKRGATMDLRTGTVVQLLAGAAVVVPAALLVDGGLPLPPSTAGAGALAWLVVGNSVGAALLLFVLLRRGTGAGVSGLLYLVPPVTALLAVPVLGQPIGVETVVGLAVTLVGVVLVNRGGKPASPKLRGTVDVRQVLASRVLL